MNILSLDQQISVIAALTEGCSIRAVERLTGIHRDTIMRLAARVGLGAIKFHDRTVHSVQVARIELDEAWSYVGKKQRTNGYRAMWAAEYETAVRSAVDTARLAGAGSFQTILQTIA